MGYAHMILVLNTPVESRRKLDNASCTVSVLTRKDLSDYFFHINVYLVLRNFFCHGG